MTSASTLATRWAMGHPSEGTQKTAYTLVKSDQLEPALEATIDTLKAIPLSKFQRTLLVAKKESNLEGRVWQRHLKVYLKEIDASLADLKELREALGDIEATTEGPINRLLGQILKSLKTPRKASTDYAISDIEFSEDPRTGKDEISYSLRILADWHDNLTSWVEGAEVDCREVLTKAQALSASSV